MCDHERLPKIKILKIFFNETDFLFRLDFKNQYKIIDFKKKILVFIIFKM